MSVSNQSVYPMYGSNQNPLIGEHTTLGKIMRLVRWVLTLCAAVLAIDFICVIFIWDDGAQTLSDLVIAEREALGLNPESAAGRFVDTAIATAHDWVFVKTGLSEFLSGQRSGFLSAIINGMWALVETAVLGLQLFVARLAVLIVSLPLFIVVGAAAVADGVYGWLMRRTSAGRESGFIYHRAKRAFPAFLFLLWAVYLIPPIQMDPRWVIPPFVVLFGIALRLRVSYFKKYI